MAAEHPFASASSRASPAPANLHHFTVRPYFTEILSP
jgi:hypothetical protein